eukprot:2647551-Prymnesium_polylepis.1
MEGVAAAAKAPVLESSSMADTPMSDTADGDSEDSEELDDYEWIRHHDVWALMIPPRDSAQPDEWRARREALERKRKEARFDSEDDAAADDSHAPTNQPSAPAQPSSAVSQLEFDERTELMFKVENPGPVTSGRLPAVQIVTKEELSFAWKSIDDCAKQRGKQLSRAYGNFDKLCGLGWLLGDVMVGRLIDGDDAYRIGRRLGKDASNLKAEFAAPLRRFGKLKKFDDNEARERLRAAAEERRRQSCGAKKS